MTIDDRKLAALVKKNMAKETKDKNPRKDKRRQYDDTLQPEGESTGDTKKIFNEMKGKRKNQS